MFRHCREMIKYKFLLFTLILPLVVNGETETTHSRRRPILDYETEYDNPVSDQIAQASTSSMRWVTPNKIVSTTHLRNYRDSDEPTIERSKKHNSGRSLKENKGLLNLDLIGSETLANTQSAQEYVTTALKMWNDNGVRASEKVPSGSYIKFDVYNAPEQEAPVRSSPTPQYSDSINQFHPKQQPFQSQSQYQSSNSQRQPIHQNIQQQYQTQQQSPIQYESQYDQSQYDQPRQQQRPETRKPIIKPQRPTKSSGGFEIYQNVVTVTNKPIPIAEVSQQPFLESITPIPYHHQSNYLNNYYQQQNFNRQQDEQYQQNPSLPTSTTPSPRYIAPRLRTKSPTRHPVHHQKIQQNIDDVKHYEPQDTGYYHNPDIKTVIKQVEPPNHTLPKEDILKHIEESVKKYMKQMHDNEGHHQPKPNKENNKNFYNVGASLSVGQSAADSDVPVISAIKTPRKNKPVYQTSQHNDGFVQVTEHYKIFPIVHSSIEPQDTQSPNDDYNSSPTPENRFNRPNKSGRGNNKYNNNNHHHQQYNQQGYDDESEVQSRGLVANQIDLTIRGRKTQQKPIDLSALDVGQSWNHGNTFDHSAALKSIQGFDQSNALHHNAASAPNLKLHFNSQTYHDINALPYNPDRDFMSTVEPPSYKKTKYSHANSHNTVNIREGSANVGASISVGQSIPGLKDEQIKPVTEDFGPIQIINGLPVVNPFNIDLQTLKLMLGTPLAPSSNSQQQNFPLTANSNSVQYKYHGPSQALPVDSYSPKYNNNPEGEGYQANYKGRSNFNDDHFSYKNGHQSGNQWEPMNSRQRGTIGSDMYVNSSNVKSVVKPTQKSKRNSKAKCNTSSANSKKTTKQPDTELRPPPRVAKYN